MEESTSGTSPLQKLMKPHMSVSKVLAVLQSLIVKIVVQCRFNRVRGHDMRNEAGDIDSVPQSVLSQALQSV